VPQAGNANNNEQMTFAEMPTIETGRKAEKTELPGAEPLAWSGSKVSTGSKRSFTAEQ
jgi:hypothetical protein